MSCCIDSYLPEAFFTRESDTPLSLTDSDHHIDMDR